MFQDLGGCLCRLLKTQSGGRVLPPKEPTWPPSQYLAISTFSYPMATLPTTHQHNSTSSSTIPLKDAEPGQSPRHIKGVNVVPMYHPRMGYLPLLAYAACNLVSPLPIGTSTVSDDSESPSVATPSPPTNWVPLPPVTQHKETSSTAHRFISGPDGALAPVSTLKPPPLGARVLRSRDVKPSVRSPHPYKDSSYGEFRHRSILDPV